MCEIDVDGKWSDTGSRAMVRIMILVRWMGTTGLRLEFMSRSDVRTRVRLIFRFMLLHG